MVTSSQKAAGNIQRQRFTAVWPAYTVVILVGIFCAVVGGLWAFDHLVVRTPIDENASIVALATLLRLGTIVVALGSVQRWGMRLPRYVVGVALWGCAAAQLAYPAAATLIKMLVLLGVVELPDTGVGNLSVQGWVHLGAVLTVFGLPGALFVLAAISHAHRSGLRSSWTPVMGSVAGIAALILIGVMIG
ncbi:hypothetical protein GCM10027421_31880 [Microbacterium shaanxiense]